METLLQDLRYGIRSFSKNPSFALVAVIILALGIGATSGVFSFLHALLLRPLPFKNADQVVVIQQVDPEGQSRDLTPFVYSFWTTEESQVFKQLAGYQGIDAILNGRDYSDQLMGARVTHGLLPLLEAIPALGRTFTDADYEAGAEAVVLISDSLWHRRFGADAEVLGQTMRLDGKQFSIVGVMPPQFWFWSGGNSNDVWIPLRFSPEELSSSLGHAVHTFGRLRPGMSISKAHAEAQTRMHWLTQSHGQLYRGWSAKVLSLRDWHNHQQPGFMEILRALPLLLGAVGFVLLIACTNLASLLLARSLPRRNEMAVRSALGASRWRLVRQLLLESFLLSGLGGLLGLLIAFWGIRMAVLLLPEEIGLIHPGGKEAIGIDLAVVSFTLLIAFSAALIVGLLPALRASKTDLSEALKVGVRTTSGAYSTQSFPVVFQITASLVLLIGSGLMLKSFLRLIRVDVGFDPDQVVTMLLLSEGHDPDFYTQLIERAKVLPGVEAVSVMSNIPAGEFWLAGEEFTIEGRPSSTAAPQAISALIDPGYFQTMKTPVLRGRPFSKYDLKGRQSVAIVSQSLVQRYFAGQDPLGKRVRPGGSASKEPWLSIVGVVGDVQHKLSPNPVPTLYACYLQQGPMGSMYLFVRTPQRAVDAVNAIRQEVWRIDKNQPITYFWTMNHIVSSSMFVTRFISWLLGGYAILALLVSLIGIYGLVSYSVTAKTHEIGIRIALGAQQEAVLGLFLRRLFVKTVIGVGAGVGAALATTPLLRSHLHGVNAADPLTYMFVSLALTTVALLAGLVPARRATKVDPIVALRSE